MNIPEGFALVPVEPTDSMKDVALKWGTKKTEWEELLAAAPPVELPSYDEDKDRELFEAFYTERAKTLPLPLGNSPLRYSGGQYINDFALFGWMVWKACAKSRDGSVGDE